MKEFLIKQVMIEDIETLETIFKLRVICRQDQGWITLDKFPNGWHDDEDFNATHFAIYNQNRIIASARINYYESISEHPLFPAFNQLHDLPLTGKIGYLAKAVVLPDFQNRGLSKMLVIARENDAMIQKAIHLLSDMTGFQIENFIHYGYRSLGLLDTSKVKWEISPINQNLMHKKI